MKKLVIVFIFSVLALPCQLFCQQNTVANQLPYQNDYAFGADVSFTKSMEDGGRKYYDVDGTEKPALEIFRQHGYNWGRVMICNEPVANNLQQDLNYVIAAAKDVKQTGMKFLLDYMFSNGWANPMVQPTPAEWVNMTHSQRVDALYQYIRRTMTALRDAGVMPEMVQVGNEIGNGFFWPDGRIFYETPELSKWDNVADYLKSAIKAIRDVAGNEFSVKIMLHVDHGGDIPMTQTFFDQMGKYGIDYDVIGLSFYPWSHGTLLDLRENLRFAALRYGKEIIVVETGYYYQPSNYFRDVPAPCPETPEGQRQWLEAVNELVLATPNGLGKGVFWWEPMRRGRGYFDQDGKVQPIIHSFEKYALPLKRTDGQTRIQ